MAKRISKEVIASIQSLRSQGYSLPEIRERVPIGYGTIFRYIKDIDIQEDKRSFWRGKRGGSVKRKLLAEREAEKKANSLGSSLSDKEKLILLTSLYWGEGSKHEFGIINSDPELIRVVIQCLTSVLHIPQNRIVVSIRIYEDLNKEQCLSFWSSLTGVMKNHIKIYVLSGRKKGTLPFGMCRIRLIKGGNELKYLKAIRKKLIQMIVPVAQLDRAEVS